MGIEGMFKKKVERKELSYEEDNAKFEILKNFNLVLLETKKDLIIKLGLSEEDANETLKKNFELEYRKNY